MEIILSSFNAVIPLFVVIAVGYVLRIFGILDEPLAIRLNKLCFTVLMPCVLFRTTYSAVFGGTALLVAVYTTIAVIVTTPVVCYVTGRFFHNNIETGTIVNGVIRANTTLLGLPLMTNLFGEDNLVCMTLIITFLIPTFNIISTIALIYYSENGAEKPSVAHMLKKIAQNPLIIAAVLGITLNLLNVPLPTVVSKPLKDLAGCATPLAMLAMGARFDFKSFTSDRLPIIYASVMRLIVIPFVIVGGAVIFGVRDIELCAVFIATGTPTAVASVAMSDAFGFDGKLAGEILLATSALSCMTLFLGVCFLRMTGLVTA